MKPAQYWRQKKQTQNYLHKVGVVTAVTLIRTAPPELQAVAPYSFAIVDFGDEQKELMGVSGEVLAVGDHVRCVLRKMGQTQPEELISYGLKIKKITEAQ